MKLVLLAALGLLGCQHDGRTDHASVAVGMERADCRPDHTCEAGLLCLSNLCVRPPPADCQVVADELASLDLGNYAEPEERAPVVAKYKAQCDTTYVSKEEGICLDKARDKWAAASCVARLYPELSAPGTECAQIGEKTRAAVARQYRGQGDQYKMYIDAMSTAARQSCTEDRWPAALTQCVLTSDPNQHVFSYGACQNQLAGELMQKLQNRYNQLLQQASR